MIIKMGFFLQALHRQIEQIHSENHENNHISGAKNDKHGVLKDGAK